MATYEKKGCLTYVDKNGNLHRLYPATQKDCIQGIEYVDAHIANNNNPHETSAEQVGAVPVERTINGKPLNDDIVLTPEDIGAAATDDTLTITGAAADAKATGDKLEELANRFDTMSDRVDSFECYSVIDPENDGNVQFLSAVYGGVVWQTFP